MLRGFQREMTGPPESFSDELPPDLFVSLELTGIDSTANLTAMGAELGTPLNEEVDKVIIERDHGITPLTFGFEYDAVGSCGFEDLADRCIRVIDRLHGHGDPPR